MPRPSGSRASAKNTDTAPSRRATPRDLSDIQANRYTRGVFLRARRTPPSAHPVGTVSGCLRTAGSQGEGRWGPLWSGSRRAKQPVAGAPESSRRGCANGRVPRITAIPVVRGGHEEAPISPAEGEAAGGRASAPWKPERVVTRQRGHPRGRRPAADPVRPHGPRLCRTRAAHGSAPRRPAHRDGPTAARSPRSAGHRGTARDGAVRRTARDDAVRPRPTGVRP